MDGIHWPAQGGLLGWIAGPVHEMSPGVLLPTGKDSLRIIMLDGMSLAGGTGAGTGTPI